jgi:hypothetical protein
LNVVSLRWRAILQLGVLCTLAGCALDRVPNGAEDGRHQNAGSGGPTYEVTGGTSGSGGVGGSAGSSGSGGSGSGGSSGVSGTLDGSVAGVDGSAGTGGIEPIADGSVPMQGDAQVAKGELYGPCSGNKDCDGDMECTASGFCANPCTDTKPCSPPPTGNPTVLCIGGECTLQCGPLNVCPDGMACLFPFSSDCGY